MDTQIERRGFSRDYILVVIGQIISIFGSALIRFALSLYVLDLTQRADVFATLFAISNIPLLLSPIGGALSDRFSRRNLMVIFDFCSAAIALGLFVLMGLGWANVPVIGLVMVLLSLISAMYSPAVVSSIPLLVGTDKLEGANGIVSGVQSLAMVAAPALGGVLYGLLGIDALVAFGAAAFFLSAVMEIFIRIPFTKREMGGHAVRTMLLDLKDAFIYVKNQSFIFRTLIFASLLNLVLTPAVIVATPLILRQTMHSSDAMYGLGLALVEFSSIVGALSIGLFSKKMRMDNLWVLILAVALLFVPTALAVTPWVLGLGFYPSFIIYIACMVLICILLTLISIFAMTKIQKVTPLENLGKVMSIMIGISQCAAPIGQLLYGFLLEGFSARVYIPMLIICVLMLGLTVLGRKVFPPEAEAGGA